jgi:hypothetical protein
MKIGTEVESDCARFHSGFFGGIKHASRIMQFLLRFWVAGDLNHNHAAGQASRRSLTLNDRLEALFPKLVGNHQKARGISKMETGATPILRG